MFYSYNPPKSQRSWVNDQAEFSAPDMLNHHSTYLTVPPEWLGKEFIALAEHLKQTKPEAYEHEYLGEITGTGAEVFTNLTARTITNEEIIRFDRIRRGLDWGYAADPLHYTVCHFDKTRKRLYIFFEIQAVHMSIRKSAKLISQENKYNKEVIADCADARSNGEIKQYGIRIRPCKKGPDSVEHGIKWLSEELEEIIIDPDRCPNTWREFYGYELARDANGNFKDGYPDKDNHSIDAVRYALEDDMTRNGWGIGNIRI